MGQSVKDPIGEAIARAAPETLAAKATQEWPRMAALAVLAGVFISFGSVISLVVQSGMGHGPTPGPVLVLSGLAFSVGLILVMVAGAELFTGNTMMVLPAVTGVLALPRMIAAWCVAWLGNLLGSVAVALLFEGAGGLGGDVSDAARSVAGDKLAKGPMAVFCSGILANALVCVAVWMSMNALSLPAKILAIVGPITLFVAAGLEHSVANMSLIPMGWLSGMADGVDWSAGLLNLAFSTAGNIVGGSLLALWLAYGHDALKPDSP